MRDLAVSLTVAGPPPNTLEGWGGQGIHRRGNAEIAVSAELVEAIAREQSRDAFRALFAHYAPRIKAYLRRLGASEGVADELAQEVMLTVWRRAHQFDRRQAAVSTWIYTIARNKRIDALRRDRWAEVDVNDPALVPEAEMGADRAIEAEQRSARLHDAVKTLPEQQATLLQMAFFEDKSHSVIAEELALPLGTVKSRLRLAMTRLRSLLEDVQ